MTLTNYNYELIFTFLFLLFLLSNNKFKSKNNTEKDSLNIYFNLSKDANIALEKRFLFTQKAFELIKSNNKLSNNLLFQLSKYSFSLKKDTFFLQNSYSVLS